MRKNQRQHKKAKYFIIVLVLALCGIGAIMGHNHTIRLQQKDEDTLNKNALQDSDTASSEGQEEAELMQDSASIIESIKSQAAGTEVDVSCLSEEEIAGLFYETEITDEIYNRINGVSFQENDNITIQELRYVRVLHCTLDKKTYIGELIVNQSITTDILDIMQQLYDAGYPIEKMVLVDEYGGDDEASMEDNNTSAFNYRVVSGTEHLSKHSYGRAIDINPLYNPYVRTGEEGDLICEPYNGTEYMDRNADFSYKIDENDLCYQLFIEHGFTWGGSWNSVKDYQHFQK